VYERSAAVYDAVYAEKDYAAEAVALEGLVRARVPEARTLLDVACGTGKHLVELGRSFDVTGIDLEPEFVRMARERLPGVDIREGDMTGFDLGSRFDVVTCLFSAIGYVRTLDGLRTAAATMARHLAPGGLLVIEPWIERENWVPGGVYSVYVDEPDLKVARVNVSPPPDADGIVRLDMHHVIGRREGVESFVERHELGMFSREEYIGALEAAGLAAEHDGDGLIGRGLYLGTRAA
jgi:SAM-dependent methyltransferase